ncbi:MAG TPA: phosphoribosylaminoimidazolesuccinocarboxamide synthase [Natronincola sp.]|nr:phosphoribosylaminoimidazolesuccinocarboxamide synthase [Natronincola sp.]
MKFIFKGKTKDVYELDDGNILLKFKDDVTGADGVFDPGANQVGLTIEGAGSAALHLTEFFFDVLKKEGVPTHYISADLKESSMTVYPATPFGEGLEVICRYRAVGSFIRRYGKYATDGMSLDGLIEFTLKDDERQDPLITKDALIMLEILSEDEYETLFSLTKTICEIIKTELAKKGLELYDIKLEFGRIGLDGRIALIDELSGGNMRVYQGDKSLSPLELTKIMVD